jgi:hypothetical protein
MVYWIGKTMLIANFKYVSKESEVYTILYAYIRSSLELDHQDAFNSTYQLTNCDRQN